MNWSQKIQKRFRALFHKDFLDAQMDDEMRSHVEMQTQENIDAGMNPEEAHHAALRQFGRVESIKDTCRDHRGVNWIQNLVQDVHYGARMLLKNPGFAAVAVLTLGLGIGANTAIFSVVNAVLLRPLPYHEPDRLVRLFGNLHRPGLEKVGVSGPEFAELSAASRSFEQLAAYHWQGMNLTGIEHPTRIFGACVSANLFSLLGVMPTIGRLFQEEESRSGHDQVVLISENFWQTWLGSDPNVVGRTVTLDGRSFIIIGVMPHSLDFPYRRIDVWRPLALNAETLSEAERGSHFLDLIGRLKPNLSLVDAQAQLDVVASQIAQDHRKTYPQGFGIRALTEHTQLIGPVRTALWTLCGAVFAVLLIACANTANLLLARSMVRAKEVAIRAALGAGRWRVVRQLLTESLVLAFIGALFGLLLARWGLQALTVLAASYLPRAGEIRLDGTVLSFALASAGISAALFGLPPALQSWRVDLNKALRQGDRRLDGGIQRHGWLRGLVVCELALTVVLLAGAGLLLKSFYLLRQVDLGFNAEKVISVRLVLPGEKYPEVAQQRTFFQQLLERLESVPGLRGAGVVTALPLSDISNDCTFSIEGRPDIGERATDSLPIADYVAISTNYFHVMKIPLVRGRSLDLVDEGATPGIMINEALARQFWPVEECIGQRIKLGNRESRSPWMTIVGVARDVKHQGLDFATKPEIYVSYLQSRLPGAAMFLVLRTTAEPHGLVPEIRQAVLELDRDEPLANIETMEERLADSLEARRFNMILLVLFAAVALLLAVVGLYGVLAFTVAQRTREIGIRMALGAQASDVLRLIVGQGMILVVIGLGIGLACAWALTRVLHGFLFKITPTDPSTFGGIALLLGAVALLACWLPAHRAVRVGPMVALRYE